MTQPNMTLGRIGLTFAGFYILFSAGLFAVFWALERFFHYSLTTDVTGVLVPFMAAMQCGTVWFGKTGARPSNGIAWKAAGIFTVITTIFSVAFASWLVSAGAYPELNEIFRDPQGRLIFAAVIAVVLGLVLLLCRFGFGMGAKQAAKIKQRADAKNAK